MNVKRLIKSCPITSGLYTFLKKKRDAHRAKMKFSYHGQFVNRSKGKKYLLVVLAGYKEYLYPAVFSRIENYSIDDLDVCVVSSGKYSEKLVELCEKNSWSYLSTKENNVSLVQNIAIRLHPEARYIFKLDEDIFITEGFFENLIRAYEHSSNGLYNPGVVAPLIPINGYAHVRVLEKLGLMSEYEKRFGSLKYAAGHDRPIENSPEVARFFWGEDGVIPDIDEMNRLFASGPVEERPVPIRFSIGAILFEKSLWEDMGYFSVERNSVSLGKDEVELCTYCNIHSRPILTSENVLVGHFSFGPQNEKMKEYFYEHEDRFLA